MGALIAISLIASQSWASYGKFPPPVAPFTNAKLPTRTVAVPMIFPIIGSFSLGGRYNVSRGRYLHTGVDIKAAKMTPVVAPFSGIIGFKKHTFWIYGDNGYKCLGTHLNDDTPGTRDGKNNFDYMFSPMIKFGERVEQGQLIGYVGDSGKATGPHLHFELFDKKSIIDPVVSLHYAQKIYSPRVPLTNRQPAPAPGEEIYYVCKKNYFPINGTLYGLLVAKQYGNRIIPTTRPTFVTFTIPEAIRNGSNPNNPNNPNNPGLHSSTLETPEAGQPLPNPTGLIEAWPTNKPAAITFTRKGGYNLVTQVAAP
jgi:murein DD-endopeptidase MepM/ murein hydrolase activator NlpD